MLFKNIHILDMPGCPYFIANTFSHILGAVLLTGVSSENSIVGDINKKPLTSFALFLLTIGLLFLMLSSEPGPPKYVMFIVFCFLLGQSLSGFVKRLEAENILSETLITVGSIFTAMTIVGFLDKGNMLSWGNYLFAGLIGLIIAQVVVIFMDKNTKKKAHVWISRFIVLLFTLYVGYDVQVLKVNAKLCKSNPDYVNESVHLYLDIVNLFTGVGNLNE